MLNEISIKKSPLHPFEKGGQGGFLPKIEQSKQFEVEEFGVRQEGKKARGQGGKEARRQGGKEAILPSCHLAITPELAKEQRSEHSSVQYISLKQLRALPDINLFAENARRQLDDAEQKAMAILERANKQAERIKDSAFKEGYQEGFAQGEETGKIKVKEEMKLLKTAIEEVSSLKSTILNNMEPEIVKLSLMLAEKLALDSLRIHPEAIATIIKNLIKNVEDEEEIKILVNPSALPILEEYLQPEVMATSATEVMATSATAEGVGERSEQFLEIIKSESKLKIEGDEKISEGGCLIVTDTKILDAQIETRILEAAKLVSGEW